MPTIETMEQSALDLARRIVDDGPSYPSIGPIFQFLREASEFGLVTVNFELSAIDTKKSAPDSTPNATGALDTKAV